MSGCSDFQLPVEKPVNAVPAVLIRTLPLWTTFNGHVDRSNKTLDPAWLALDNLRVRLFAAEWHDRGAERWIELTLDALLDKWYKQSELRQSSGK